MKNCKHKLKHTEITPYKHGIVFRNYLFGKYYEYKIEETLEKIRTYCANCGKLLKTVELPSPYPKKTNIQVICKCNESSQ